jgi:pimeloyl-ACP methyl ester carboxylesterase
MVMILGVLPRRFCSVLFPLVACLSGCGKPGEESFGGAVSVVQQAATETPMCVPPPDDIVAWWPGDGNADDIAGDHTGTIEGGVAFPFEGGKVGQAFSFDGTNGTLIRASADGFPAGSEPRTIEFWTHLRPDGNPNTENMPAFGYGPASAGQVFYTFPQIDKYDGRLAFSGGGLAYDLVTTSDLRDDKWHHVAVSYDGDVVTIYVDGNAVKSGHFQLNTGATGGACIGGSCIDGSALQSLTGQVDEVTLYSRALARTEIESIVAAGSAGKCKRKKVVILFQGINTSLINCASGACEPGDAGGRRSPETFADLRALLELQGFEEGESVFWYSYEGGTATNGRWLPREYRCGDTANRYEDSLAELRFMLNQLGSQIDNADFYLVGHSQGGLIALQALAYLGDLRPDDRIRGVFTLDSPLGGSPASHANIADLFTCWGNPAKRELVDLFRTGMERGRPSPAQGSRAMPLCRLLGVCTNPSLTGIATNFALAQRAMQNGVAVFTFGNRSDAIFRPSMCGFPGLPNNIESQRIEGTGGGFIDVDVGVGLCLTANHSVIQSAAASRVSDAITTD